MTPQQFPDKCTTLDDKIASLENEAQRLKLSGGGTLRLSDGLHGISRTLRLPMRVSLVLQPGAILRAMPDFAGESLIETESYEKVANSQENARWTPQVIEGGILDGGGQPLIGIRTIRDRETDIRNILVRNCLRKGLHLGVEEGCEVNLFNVRVHCERGVFAEEDSIGIHYDRCTDSLVCGVIVIGYATGIRSDSSSSDFQQAHVWNYDLNCRLKTCFRCNGWNDSWNQCYADSPMNGDDIGYGFHVSRPFNRISNSRIYNNKWTTPDKVIGVFIDEGGTHGTYMGNHFTAQSGHRMLKAFDGNLDSATIIGNTFDPHIAGGLVAQVPSGGGGLSRMPELVIAPIFGQKG